MAKVAALEMLGLGKEAFLIMHEYSCLISFANADDDNRGRLHWRNKIVLLLFKYFKIQTKMELSLNKEQ